MSQLMQALVGWLIIMGMVFGGVGALFFALSLVRSLIALTRPVRLTAPETREVPAA